MDRVHQLLISAVAMLAVLGTGVVGLPAAHAQSGATSTRLTTTPKTVNGHQLSKITSEVHPLTSSTDTSEIGVPWSVFSRTDRTADLQAYGGNNGPDVVGSLTATAANARHTTHTFGVVTRAMGRFSSSGHVVTAGSIHDPQRVYWWMHPFRTRSDLPPKSTRVPDGYRYLTSAPDGWIEADASGQLYDVNARSKEASPLGPPFANASLSAVSGPTGVVVTYDKQVAFVSFSTARVTALDSSLITDQASCWSVSRRGAACGNLVVDSDGDQETSKLFLTPLDGSAAFDVVNIPDLNDDNPPVIPATFKNAIAWLSTSEHDELNVKTPDGRRTTSSRLGNYPVAGPGGFLTSNAGRSVILAFDRQLHSHTLVAKRSSHAEALAFSLSKKRIAWTEDDGAPRATALRVHRRSITRNGGVPRLGGTTTVADDAQRSAIAVSAKYTVYAVGDPKISGFGHRLRVVSRDDSRTIKHVQTRDYITLSGHRLLYATSDHEAAITDLKSGKTTSYSCLQAALDGPHLVLASSDGSGQGTADIRLVNLKTGDDQNVATGVNFYDVQPAVFVHKSVVGWLDYTPNDPHFGPRSQYRDTSTNDPAVTLPPDQLLYALTDAGALVETPRWAVQQFESHVVFVPAARVDFSLRPYDSSGADRVLTGYYLKVGPQVAGGVIAWVDAQGHLKMRRLHS